MKIIEIFTFKDIDYDMRVYTLYSLMITWGKGERDKAVKRIKIV